MIAAEVSLWEHDADEPEYQDNQCIELTEWGGPFIELAADLGDKRIYLNFRLSDLVREVKEARKS